MSDEVIIEAVNDVYVRIQAEPSVKMELSDHFTFKVPGAEFMPSYRNKIWDGKIRLLNLMTGMIYRGLVPYILNFCNSREYEVTVDKGIVPDNEVQDTAGYDLAKEFESVFTPREYQNNAVVHALKHERALLLSPTSPQAQVGGFVYRQVFQ